MRDGAPALVDYHRHLDLYPDYVEQFQVCDREQIATLAVGTIPSAWPVNKELASGTSCVRAALGFHPQLVGERPGEFAVFERHFPEARFIGEVGLDASPAHFSSYHQQMSVFERILRMCAEMGGKVLSVHALRSARDALNLIGECLPADRGRVVLHWFSGSGAETALAIDLGCYFSINAEMLQQGRGSSLVGTLPVDRILTETDGPFTQTSGQSSQAEDVAATAQRLAGVLQIDAVQMQNQILANLTALESQMSSA